MEEWTANYYTIGIDAGLLGPIVATATDSGEWSVFYGTGIMRAVRKGQVANLQEAKDEAARQATKLAQDIKAAPWDVAGERTTWNGK